MKKRILAASLLALALGLSACSSGKDETATTAAAETTTAAETTAQDGTTEAQDQTEEEDEDVEEDYIIGWITAIDGDILTIRDDGADEEKKYDTADAEINLEFPLSVGDQVEVTFPAETTEDPVPVIYLDVLESETAKNTDPAVEAEIVSLDQDSVTIRAEDGEYTLIRTNAYEVGEISNGATVTVTYLGELDDEALAVKIVAEASYDTPEAQTNGFVGTVAQIEDERLVLESAQGDFLTFVSGDLDFSEHAVGDKVTVIYTGSISAKDIPAVEIR